MFDKDEFRKYATKHRGISSLVYDQYQSIHADYISPTIIEERQMNVASMDVFSRLMMDRIIFIGTGINDYVANIIQAQLLFLESVDAKKDIQKLKVELYEIIAKHSNQPYDKVWADSDRDCWMIAKEAKEYGMIDEVLT